MTTRYVPSQYSTISTAISACSPGDEVIVNGGTYVENIAPSVNNVTLKAAWGTRVAVTGRVSIRTGLVISGFDFTYTTTTGSDAAIIQAATPTSFRLTDCSFTVAGSGYGINFGTASASGEYIIDRCKFTNNSAGGNRLMWISDWANLHIHSCIFIDWSTTATAVFRFTSTGSTKNLYFYNNVVYNCDASGSSRVVMVLDGGTTGTKRISNCIFQDCTITGSRLITITAGGTRTYGNCCHYNNSTGTLASGGTDLGGHVTFDSLWNTTTYMLSTNSPCVNTGTITYAATKDYFGRAFTTSDDTEIPNIGATQNLSGSSWAFYVKREHTNIAYGLTITISAVNASFPTAKESFSDPWEVANYLEYICLDTTEVGSGGFFRCVWCTDNRFRIVTTRSMTYTFTVASIFGEVSGVTTDTSTALGGDEHLYIFSSELEEEPQGSFKDYQLFTSPYGRVVGYGHLATVDNIVFSFSGVSEEELLFPLFSTTSLRDLLDLFYSGYTMRVYRAFPSVLDQYDESYPSPTLTGYTDIIVKNAPDYKWNDSVLGRFSFRIEGYSTATNTGLTGF